MRIFISELYQVHHENVEICGKVVYINYGNKNVSIKSINALINIL